MLEHVGLGEGFGNGGFDMMCLDTSVGQLTPNAGRRPPFQVAARPGVEPCILQVIHVALALDFFNSLESHGSGGASLPELAGQFGA
jgi:hypothetical protein